MFTAERRWEEHNPLIVKMAGYAYRRSSYPNDFDLDDFVQEGALCLLRCVDLDDGRAPFHHFLAFVVRRRFISILMSQHLRARLFFPLEEAAGTTVLFDTQPLELFSQAFSPITQDVFWCIIDPPDKLLTILQARERYLLSRRVLAEYFQADPAIISDSLQEIKESLLC